MREGPNGSPGSHPSTMSRQEEGAQLPLREARTFTPTFCFTSGLAWLVAPPRIGSPDTYFFPPPPWVSYLPSPVWPPPAAQRTSSRLPRAAPMSGRPLVGDNNDNNHTKLLREGIVLLRLHDKKRRQLQGTRVEIHKKPRSGARRLEVQTGLHLPCALAGRVSV